MSKIQATLDGQPLANVYVEDSDAVQVHNGYLYVGGSAVTCNRCGGMVEKSTFDFFDLDIQEAAEDDFMCLCQTCIDTDAAEEACEQRFRDDPELQPLFDDDDELHQTLATWHTFQEILEASNDQIWQWYEQA